MTDQPTGTTLGVDYFPTGSIHSQDSEADFPGELLFALAGVADTVPPPSRKAPLPYPGILSQIGGRCVAYGSDWMKTFQDLRDTGPVSLDPLAFFARIPGSDPSYGAVPANAMALMQSWGYPVAGHPELAGDHRIRTGYRVAVDQNSIELAFGLSDVLGFSVEWWDSWSRPPASGILPAPSGTHTGHFFAGIGYTAAGVLGVQTWGPGWGGYDPDAKTRGFFTMPWAYLGQVKEVWCALDVVEPSATTFLLQVPKGAVVHSSVKNAAGLYVVPDKASPKFAKASSAVCTAPSRARTTAGDWITATRVVQPSSGLNGRWVHLGGVPAVIVTRA